MLIGMEIEPKNTLIQLLTLVPHDVKQKIISHAKPKQWWYLDKIFKHKGYIESVCFDPSGKFLVTASGDHTARVFDIQKPQAISSFSPGNYIASACFDLSGKFIATASYNGKAHIFNIETRQEITAFEHGFHPFSSFYFTPSEELIVIKVNKPKGAYFRPAFDLETYQNIGFDLGENREYYHVISSPSGKHIAAVLGGGDLRKFKQYDNCTLEQLLLKKALLTWLLIEKPNKKIGTPKNLIKDVALKCTIPCEELITIWSTFPENMQNAIWRTMQHRIQTYGKNNGSSYTYNKK
jgi:WD40 repeat protein